MFHSSTSNYPNPMLGSIHTYSNGYGYGMRMPTSRNKPAETFSVPKYRHPPDSARFIAGTKSKPQILKDEVGERRNNESIKFLTSGEVGLHTTSAFNDPLFNSISPLNNTNRLNHNNTNRSARNKNIFLSNEPTPRDTPLDSTRSSVPPTSRSINSSNNNNKFNIDSPQVSSRLNPFLDNTYRSSNSINNNKQIMDVILKSEKSYRELSWAASSTNLAARQSHPWSESLRR